MLVAGFYLVELAGLPGTLVAAAMLNLVVAAATIVRRWSAPDAQCRPPPAPTRDEPPSSSLPAAVGRSASRCCCSQASRTAVASFIYEIAWIRMLALVLGSATHSFELMLSAFILGLALGAWWIRSRADRLADPLRTLGIVQWTMGALALATLPLYVALVRVDGRPARHVRPDRCRLHRVHDHAIRRCAWSSCCRPPSAPG